MDKEVTEAKVSARIVAYELGSLNVLRKLADYRFFKDESRAKTIRGLLADLAVEGRKLGVTLGEHHDLV